MGDHHDEALTEALGLSQRLGMLGSRPVVEVIDQATAYVEALDAVGLTGGVVVDLGSGGGVPGLVIARQRPALQLVLVDRRATRTDHLRRLVVRLGLTGRVEVLTADAALLPRLIPTPVAAVVARGFGPPAELLAVAVPLVGPGGVVVVSEPPEPDPTRWPAAALEEHGVERVAHPDQRVALLRRI